jgi:hypothetical protein
MRTFGILILGCLSAALASAAIYGGWFAIADRDPTFPPASLGWSMAVGCGVAVRGVARELWP